MNVNSENPETQRAESHEQLEGRRVEAQEQPTSPETMESLEKKIIDIDERIGDYTASIEDTSEKLTQARGELNLPAVTTEAPSITQSRETMARLDQEKQALEAQIETLGGDEATRERPKRITDDPRFRELSDATPFQLVPKAFEVHKYVVETLFRQRYPEDAAAYDALAQAEYQKEQSLAMEQRQNVKAKKAADMRAARKASGYRQVDKLIADRQTLTFDTNLLGEYRSRRVAETAANVAADTQRQDENEAYLQWMEAHPDAAPEDYFDKKTKANHVDTTVQSDGTISKDESRSSGDRFADLRARQAVRLEALKRSDITPEEHQKILDEYVAEAATISEMKPTGGHQSERKIGSLGKAETESTSVDRVSLERNLGNLWVESDLTPSPELDALRLQVQTASGDDAKRLNEAFTKAARIYARTRKPEILAETLQALSNKQEPTLQDETKKAYSQFGVTAPDFIPDSTAAPIERKESPSVSDTLNQEKLDLEITGEAIKRFALSPESFLDKMPDSDAHYSSKKGIKTMVDAFKDLYPNPSERAARLQDIYSAYRTTRDLFKQKSPEKGSDYAKGYADNQTTAGLPQRELQLLKHHISEKLDVSHPGGGKTRFTPELVMSDFFSLLDGLNT